MSTPNLPLRYQMITTASSPASELRTMCASVISEGLSGDAGILRYKSTEGTHLDANVENTIYALIGIRLKGAYLGTTLELAMASVKVQTASDEVEWLLILDPTIAGSPTWVDLSNSAVQTFAGATANTITGGTVLIGGFIETGTGSSGVASASQSTESNELIPGSFIDGTPQTVVLCIRPVNGSTSVDVEGSLNWIEDQ